MSNVTITPLGQTQADISQTLEEQYAALREKCIAWRGEEFCNSVLPRNMVYAVTRRPEGASVLPWWGWMILGLLAGKLVR